MPGGERTFVVVSVAADLPWSRIPPCRGSCGVAVAREKQQKKWESGWGTEGI